MLIGAKDQIDELLVQKYANLQANKIEPTNMADKAIPAERVMDIMNDYAKLKMIAVQIDKKLSSKNLNLKPAQKYA